MFSPFRPQTLHRTQSSVNYHHVEKIPHESPHPPLSWSRDTGTATKWLLIIEYGGELLPAGQEEGRGSVLAVLRPTAHQQLVHLIQDLHLPSPLGLHLFLALPDLAVAPSISESVWQHLFAPHFHTAPTLSAEQHHLNQSYGGLPIAARLVLRLDKHQARWYESWKRDPLDGLVEKWVNLAGVSSVGGRKRDSMGLKSATDDSLTEDTHKEHRPRRPTVDTSPPPVVATSSPPRPRRSPLRPSPPRSVISQRTSQRDVEPETLMHATSGSSLELQTTLPVSPACPSAASVRQHREPLDFPTNPVPLPQEVLDSPISIMSLHPCSAEPWTPHTPHNDPTRWPYPGLDSPSTNNAPLVWPARSVATSWGPPFGGSLPSPLDPLGRKDWIRTPDLAERSRFSVPTTPRSPSPPPPPPSHGHDTVPPPPIRQTPWALVWPFFTAVELPAASPNPHGHFPGHNHPSEPPPPVPIQSGDLAPSPSHPLVPDSTSKPHADPAASHHTPPRPARTPSTFVPFEEIAFGDTPNLSLAPRPAPAPFKLAPPPAKRVFLPDPSSQAGFSTANVRESHQGDNSPGDSSPRPFSNLGPEVDLDTPVLHEPPPPPPAPTTRGLLRRFSMRKPKPSQSISEAQGQGQYQSSSARQSSVSLTSTASKEPIRPLKRVSQTIGGFSEGGVDSGPPLNSPRENQGRSMLDAGTDKCRDDLEEFDMVSIAQGVSSHGDLSTHTNRAERPDDQGASSKVSSPGDLLSSISTRDTLSHSHGYPNLVIYPKINTRSPAVRKAVVRTPLSSVRPELPPPAIVIPIGKLDYPDIVLYPRADRTMTAPSQPSVAQSPAHISILLSCFNYPDLVIYPSLAGPIEVPPSVKTCYTPPRKSTGKCPINTPLLLTHFRYPYPVNHPLAAAPINVLLYRAGYYPNINIYPFKPVPLVILLSSYQYPDIFIYPAVDRRRLDRPVQSDAPRETPRRPARSTHQLDDLITYDLPHRAGHGRATSTSSLPSTVLSTPTACSPRSPPPLPTKSLQRELTRSTSRATMFDLDSETDSLVTFRPPGGAVATTSAKSLSLSLARNRSSTLVSERTRALFGDHHGEPSVVSPAVRVSRSRTMTSASRPSDMPTDQPSPGSRPSHTRGRSVGKLPATMMRNWI